MKKTTISIVFAFTSKTSSAFNLKSKKARETSCAHECSEIPSMSVEYCKATTWSVCRTDTSWAAQDTQVKASLVDLNFFTTINTPPSKFGLPLLNPDTHQNTHPQDDSYYNATIFSPDQYECINDLMLLECNLIFPPCEIGTETRPVCRSACESVVKKCSDTLNLPSTLCDDLSLQEKDSGDCVKLAYEGANRMLWIAGFSIALAFSFLAALGLNLQKLSMNREKGLPEEMRRPPIKQPLWVIGLTLITSGSLLDFVAFGMAPQSLLAPLGALSLVWNLIIAPIFHSEKLTKQNLTATGIICFGTIMTVIAAPHSTPTYTLKDLIALYKDPIMNVYMICVLGFLGGLFYTLKKIGLTNDIEKVPNNNYGGGGGGVGNAINPENTNPVVFPPTPEQQNLDKQYEMKRIICLGGLAGCFGGQSVLLAKSTAELAKNALFEEGGDAFNHVLPYVIIVLMICCLLTQISILNFGLSKFNALIMVPVYQTFWNGSSVLGGIIYFQEYRDLTAVAAGFFIGGLATTLGGVVYLLRTRTDHDQAKREGKKYSKLDSSDSSDEDQEGGVSDNSINFDDFEGTGVSKMSENGGEKIEMGYLENGNMNMAEEEGAGGGARARSNSKDFQV